MSAMLQTQAKLPAVVNATVEQDQQQYLTFMLGGETYAMGILAIKEIIEYGNLTEVPRMPPFIRGVITGMGKVNGKFVIILNIQHVLSVDEMATLSEIEQSGSATSAAI